MMMTVQQTAPFSGLLLFVFSRYSFPAVAKSAAGICSPCNLLATQHAPSVFFYVVAQTHLFFGLWCLHRGSCQIMVVRAGQPSGWPVSNKAGTANPVRATTHEICSSGGGDNRYLLEIAAMATTLTPSHPQFVFVFAAVRRADRTPRICMLRTVAGDEHAARLSLVRDYVLSFAGRLPVAEVRA
ncbi:ash family protein [Salmonella enterica subsp. enterica serovar Uganda]|uniref:host cell division inhibitor Icd-like protein n=1 Tax=Salmonella enterica TaxID=28901 RepID=UPI0009A9759A|nr:host cell division inhibitor Icd-like protein [Salmonella enterica]EAS5023105.1 host cell division inhibitor Icd-like protein [Salmonella enterica subsp. enterica]EAA9588152.1 host cell division inhibitor Icd-like protein [Salmonella enterica]EAM7249713.1 host cell division inhibitor Icd-like protein [Salmonella enterica]EAN4054459.1 host cell division inhibitor Icd-like protein [Salmonella enterica]EAP2029377.1 host cell division inhibitor Icd-like protein [Salmonella enterica subsp. enter